MAALVLCVAFVIVGLMLARWGYGDGLEQHLTGGRVAAFWAGLTMASIGVLAVVAVAITWIVLAATDWLNT